MCGRQFGFSYNDYSNLNIICDIIQNSVNKSLDEYNLTDYNIMYIQLAFRPMNKQIITEFGNSDL